ncbi:MAG: HDIG domain-containing protein [Spirochaetaceae bacterium]|jgi:putative nucleotidyltransferase with HDIG domain|nr:HDIG domain-containing protein [Spirochaetaceae bacterium]
MKKNNNNEEQPNVIASIMDTLKSTGFSKKQTAATLVSFIISAALFLSDKNTGTYTLIGRSIQFFLYFVFFIFFTGRRFTGTSGRRRTEAEVVLMSILSAGYFIAVFFVRNTKVFGGYMPISTIMPTALVVMLVSISIDSRLGMITALILPLGAFLSGCVNAYSYIAAIASGVSGALSLRKARRRMDMVKAGAIIGAVNIVSSLSILFIQACPPHFYLYILFWSAVNGVASGMLVLGILPVIENALHLATTFRLIELLDTGAPVLRRLENSAPGTYSHSMMVANLAETACNEIGGNALLARVGAYYHDIGKIDHPEYFVENQKLYNKHNELNPRLSATIIRSHVKLGIEKARSIGLPNDVISIIAEHHGNSLIKWFYNAALEKEGRVNMEDFCYPGNPPRSRESAVVMLADVTEAASRTLEKPTVSRLEKFIGDLFADKYANGQLSESALTFRDLETIKSSFVRVLVGFYHSRIEYPKISKAEMPLPSSPPPVGAPVPQADGG